MEGKRAERVKWYYREVAKKTKVLEALRKLSEVLERNRRELVKAPIVGMQAFADVRKAMGLNARNIEVAEQELKRNQLLLDIEVEQAKVECQNSTQTPTLS
jgi:hypothetical protein